VGHDTKPERNANGPARERGQQWLDGFTASKLDGLFNTRKLAMRLRHRADVRTLVWALLFMPAAATAQYASQRLAGWLLPVSMYLAYSAGVIAHNHNHSPTFAGRRTNALFSMWISFFYGYPVFAWIPTHNENHHKFVNGPGDATSTLRMTRDSGLLAAVRFPLLSAAAQAPLIARVLARTKRRSPRAYAAYAAQKIVVFMGHAAACGLAIGLHGAARGACVYASALGLPAVGALWGLMFTNYVQHVDCDPSSRWRRSRDFVSGFMNFFVFDNGFHTVHHEQAGLHWSKTRQAHARIAHRLDPRLQESSIFAYVFKAYVRKPWLPRTLAAYVDPSQPPLVSESRTRRTPSATDDADASTTSSRFSSEAARARCSSSAAVSIDTSARRPASAIARAAESHRAPASAESRTALAPRSKSALSTA
jgi:beta-carotene hydroxylase